MSRPVGTKRIVEDLIKSKLVELDSEFESLYNMVDSVFGPKLIEVIGKILATFRIENNDKNITLLLKHLSKSHTEGIVNFAKSNKTLILKGMLND